MTTKTKVSKFYTAEPRRETDTRVECHAMPELFLPWDEMSKAAQNEFTKNGSIPCEGGGVPGIWCDGCRFGVVAEPEDV